MSTIYDNKDAMEAFEETRKDDIVQSPSQPIAQMESQSPIDKDESEKDNEAQRAEYQNEVSKFEQRAAKALDLVDDVVLKNYLTKLEELPLADPLLEVGTIDNSDFRLFKINKMVYEKDEYATDKFISVVNAMTYANCSIYLIVDGKVNHTDFYLGIKGDKTDDRRETSSIAKTFQYALAGQFPGILMDNHLEKKKKKAKFSPQQILLKEMGCATSFSSYAGVPANRNSKGEYTNANFIQGIEKFATAMQGHRYTAVILATNTTAQEIANIRNGYENIYTELSAMATQQLAYSTNESMANAVSRTKGFSDTHTKSEGIAQADGITHTDSNAVGKSKAKADSEGESKQNFLGKLGGVSGPLMTTGAILAGTGVGAPIGLAIMGVGAAGSIAGAIGDKTKTKSTTTTNTYTTTETTSDGETHTTTRTTTESDGHTDSFSETDGTTATVGSSKNFTITFQNKHIHEILKRIDKQLERIEMSESTGLWSVGTYFLSYNTDQYVAETAASIFRSIMQGEQSGVEVSAINSWYEGDPESKNLIKYATSLSHPLFGYDTIQGRVELTPTSLLSSKEVAMMIGLPRKSVPGLPVVDHASLAKEVVKLGVIQENSKMSLGCVFDQGQLLKDNPVELDEKSLTQHTLVTGSTGCGKSNTIYHLINQIQEKQNKVHFLIIEPAKGEYKNVFRDYFDVYGTNPLVSKLLKINPFKFPSKFVEIKDDKGNVIEKKGVHVLEHIDRLTEIFNVCWPMYAAMPAVLKEAMLCSYEDCGWDLYHSTNKYSDDVFPNFTDLLNKLVDVIAKSAYSEEVKSNYTGSLVTRVKSLAIGVNKHIFCDNDLGDEMLFDKDVIVDLSRLGSQETKALIMGILVMRLNEYRANSAIEANSGLRHITILEEAHNLLKRCSTEQNMESANVAGKSVEMISNSIAEMRTYGEGFVIVDQSPSAIDISAIRNTNTKIIMRLPEENDRKTAGKSAAMKDEQIDEIAKLPTGVAVVYQNDWEAPVLCQIDEFKGERKQNNSKGESENEAKESQYDSNEIRIEILKLLLKGRIKGVVEPDLDVIRKGLDRAELSTYHKIKVLEILKEFDDTQEIHLWKNNHFKELSSLVTGIVSMKTKVESLARGEQDFQALDDALCESINNEIPNLPKELELEFRHCLMCDYALDDEQKINIYNAWFQIVNKKNI